MARALTDLFQINGKPMLLPDEEMEMSFEDVDASDSGRDESGVMHRVVVRHKLGSWNFVYGALTEAERTYLEGLFENSKDFLFTRPDRLDSSKTVTTRCYRSNYALSWFNAKAGLWKNYKFTIIEC